MNCPSKTDPILPDGFNQSPNALSSDLTTRSDLGRIASARLQDDHRIGEAEARHIELDAIQSHDEGIPRSLSYGKGVGMAMERRASYGEQMLQTTLGHHTASHGASSTNSTTPPWKRFHKRSLTTLKKYASFIGPGFLISVAYIDPGNYATDVAAGATYRFRLLFVVLMSNVFAIFLQSLCIKLGSITGLNLAENIKLHCPKWLNLILYVFAESAIIATDIAEVIGTAIALNLLCPRIPLVAGCAISIVDVLFILIFYRPDGASMRALRIFECGVMLLVLGVVVCFCFQLSLLPATVSAGEVFKGYLPSSALVEGKGLYQACGILGATVMPHSLYLGSGIIQPRLKEYDRKHDLLPASTPSIDDDDDNEKDEIYKPSLAAIKACMSYSIAELGISLFTFALFVNSAILITAGASLYSISGAADADLFGIHRLLSTSLAPAAGTVFALALLLSGTSAGIVCTIAGQMVSEGQLDLKVKPWVRRLMTRSISITPSIIIAGAVGGPGLSKALEGTQVALSVILPFVSAPLLWFTCRGKYMMAGNGTGGSGDERAGDGSGQGVQMRNHWFTNVIAVGVWGIIVVMNVALLVLLGLGVH